MLPPGPKGHVLVGSLPEFAKRLPRYAYFAFGGGPRL